MGCIFPVVTTAVQNAVPRQQIGTATAAGLMFRQVGASIAVALFGALFATRMAHLMGGAPVDGLANVAELGPQVLAGLSREARGVVADAISTALHPVYWIAAGVSAVGLLIAVLLKEIPLSSRRT
jgi:hypothetical protein